MPRTNSLEKTLMLVKIEGGRRRERQRMSWLDSITNTTDMSLSRLRELVMDREACRTVVHGIAKSWTRLSDWTELAVVLQSLSCVQLFVNPWTAASQAFLSFTISWSLVRFMSIESMMLPNHLMLCHHFLLLPSTFPVSGSFPVSQLFASGGQIIGALASVLSTNIQGWFTPEFTSLISLLSKGLSRVFSSTTAQKHQFFGIQSYLWFTSHIHTWPVEKP